MVKKKIVLSRGKRKSAIARAVVKSGKGNITINKLSVEAYLNNPYLVKLIEDVVITIGPKMKKLDINVNVKGGGVMGQIDAIRRAIATGVVDYLKDDKLKETLQSYDNALIIEDSRRIEPKKDRRKKARAKYQKSYR